MTTPKISVIISAFNRRRYLKGAVGSILSQSIPRDWYEIIVVKNFSDDLLDDYLINNEVVNQLLGNESYGFYLATGVRKAKAPIIAFLEDDDEFEKGKLGAVLDRFCSDSCLGFYRNNLSYMNSEGEHLQNISPNDITFKLDRLRRVYIDNEKKQNLAYVGKLYPWSNPSAMTIKRVLIKEYLDYLQQIQSLADVFLFLSSLASQWSVLIDSDRLTRYRFHELNNSLAIGKSEQEAFRWLYSYYKRNQSDYTGLRALATSSHRRSLENEVEALNLVMSLHLQFCSNDMDPQKMLQILLRLLKYRGTMYFEASSSAILGAVAYVCSPKIARSFYVRQVLKHSPNGK